MPLSLRSRYHGLDIFDAPSPAGDRRPTVAIRRPDAAGARGAAYRHLVTGGEEVDYLAWRYFGSAEAWWRIADANPARFPLDLVSGEGLDIPSPASAGRIQRSRRF